MFNKNQIISYSLVIVFVAISFLGHPFVLAKESAKEVIKNELKIKLEESKKHLEDPAELIDVTFVDIENGYSYNEKEGLKKIDIYKVKNGKVTFKDGSVIPVNNDCGQFFTMTSNNSELKNSSQSTYSEFRRVRSYSGYRKTEGYITLPSSSDISGVNASGEAAYNYMGIGGTINVEQGLVMGGLYGGVWRVYHNISGNWVDDKWPTNGIPAGTKVFLREYVPQDNQIALYISYSGGSKTFIYTAQGAKYDGTNQDMRRVTSLLLNGNGYSKKNIWSNVYIANKSEMHLWGTADTKVGKDYTEKTTYVTTTNVDPYYNETINIDCP